MSEIPQTSLGLERHHLAAEGAGDRADQGVSAQSEAWKQPAAHLIARGFRRNATVA